MNKETVVRSGINGFILLSAFSILSVGLMAFFQPQSLMNLVNVKLGNTDAFSSIRGVYGGVGFTIFVILIHLLRNDKQKALAFLSLLWGLYAVSRIVTIFSEGPLGVFGTKWLVIEAAFFLISVSLLAFSKKQEKKWVTG